MEGQASSGPRTPLPWRRATSTSARRPSTAARTRSNATSSPSRFSGLWGADMDFEFTEEQSLLAEAVRKFMAARYGSESRRASHQAPGAWSRPIWQSLAEMGLLAILVPSEQGGMGGGPVDVMVAMNEFGAGILLEPYWSSAVLATTLVRKLGGPSAGALLEGLGTGTRIAAVAHGEPGNRYDLDRVRTIARPTADGWTLVGTKALVLGAGAADTLLVSARTGDDSDPSVFSVPCRSPGVRLRE